MEIKKNCPVCYGMGWTSKGGRYTSGEKKVCEVCNGTGKIPTKVKPLPPETYRKSR